MSFTLGFCPTMSGWAKRLNSIDNSIELYPLNSAAEALYYVKNGMVDGIVVGRYAKKREISPAIDKRCLVKEGATLVNRQKGFVEQSDLKFLKIVTYLAEEKVREMLPDTQNMIFVDSFESAVAQLNSVDAALIDWHDYRDEFELLIPVEKGEKVKRFRLPVLYYNRQKQDYVRDLLQAIEGAPV